MTRSLRAVFVALMLALTQELRKRQSNLSVGLEDSSRHGCTYSSFVRMILRFARAAPVEAASAAMIEDACYASAVCHLCVGVCVEKELLLKKLEKGLEYLTRKKNAVRSEYVRRKGGRKVISPAHAIAGKRCRSGSLTRRVGLHVQSRISLDRGSRKNV